MSTLANTKEDGWLLAARGVLTFTGVCYGALMVVAPFIASAKLDSTRHLHAPRAAGVVFSVALIGVCAGLAALNLAAAWGLGKARPWAWTIGVILGGIYTASACLPFGAIILHALLRGDVRKSFVAASGTT